MKNHFQLEPDIPVSRYKHEVRPSRGINERFFMKEITESMIAVIQNIRVAIFTAGV